MIRLCGILMLVFLPHHYTESWVASSSARIYQLYPKSTIWESTDGLSSFDDYTGAFSEVYYRSKLSESWAAGYQIIQLDPEIGELPGITNYTSETWTDERRNSGHAFIKDLIDIARDETPHMKLMWYFNHVRPREDIPLSDAVRDSLRWINNGPNLPWSGLDSISPSFYYREGMGDWINTQDDSDLWAGVRALYEPWYAEVHEFHHNITPNLWAEFHPSGSILDPNTLIPRAVWRDTLAYHERFERIIMFIGSDSPNDADVRLTVDLTAHTETRKAATTRYERLLRSLA